MKLEPCRCGEAPYILPVRRNACGTRRARVAERIACAFCKNTTGASSSRQVLENEWNLSARHGKSNTKAEARRE